MQSITVQPTHIEMPIHCTLKLITGKGDRSTARDFVVSTMETTSPQKNRMRRGKRLKMAHSSIGATFRNTAVASPAIRPFASMEMTHQPFTAGGITFLCRTGTSPSSSETKGSSGINVFQKRIQPGLRCGFQFVGASRLSYLCHRTLAAIVERWRRQDRRVL